MNAPAAFLKSRECDAVPAGRVGGWEGVSVLNKINITWYHFVLSVTSFRAYWDRQTIGSTCGESILYLVEGGGMEGW